MNEKLENISNVSLYKEDKNETYITSFYWSLALYITYIVPDRL